MPRILIVGCGYVGRATADLFHESGWEVAGWTASAESAEQLSANVPYPIRAVDITSPTKTASAAAECDAVIQCVSSRGGDVAAYRQIYLAGARNLAAAFPNALLIFTSSTSVYAQSTGEWVTEQSAAEPLRETARVLRETEEVILALGGIVARLAGIYGPGRSGLLRKFLEGTAVLDPTPDRFLNQVHRDDAATALYRLVQQDREPTASGNREPSQIFNVSDNHPLTQRECYEWLAARLHRLLPPPASGPWERKRGSSNKRVSSEKLQALGWAPRYPTFQFAMADSILPHAGL